MQNVAYMNSIGVCLIIYGVAVLTAMRPIVCHCRSTWPTEKKYFYFVKCSNSL